MSSKAVRVRSLALYFACKSRRNEKHTMFVSRALSAVRKQWLLQRRFLALTSGRCTGLRLVPLLLKERRWAGQEMVAGKLLHELLPRNVLGDGSVVNKDATESSVC